MIHRITDNSLTDHSSWRHDGEVLIRVENVSKKFCRNLRKSLWYGVQDIAAELNPFPRKRRLPGNGSALSVASCPSPITGGGAFDPNSKEPSTSNSSLRDGEFWALNNASFELRRGECLGLIGRNGAGKTTLLKMLNGLIKPDHGRIEMRGRVGALIALGAGFNPILTGRENIYINGAILGLSKLEIDEKLDGIIEFADIHEFIDAPVQSYSSGMQTRLGFAVATALNPDVLILDEVLAVGDAAFRFKCYNRIASLQQRAAVILVSHSMEQIAKNCDRSLLLSKGRALAFGDVAEAIQRYQVLNAEQPNSTDSFGKTAPPVISASARLCADTVSPGQTLSVMLDFVCTQQIPGAHLRIQIYDQNHVLVGEAISQCAQERVTLEVGSSKYNIAFGPLHLKGGKYLLSILVHDGKKQGILFWSFKQLLFLVSGFDWCCAAYQVPLASVQKEPIVYNLR